MGAFEGFDLVVDSFEGAGRNGVVIPSQQAVLVGQQEVGEVLQNPYSRCQTFLIPGQQKASGFFFGVLLPELAQVLLQVIGGRQVFVECESFFQTSAFITLIVEAVGIPQQ